MARTAKGGTGNRVTITRALSKLGYCSRTQAERLLAEGRISIGGKPVPDFETWVDIRSDRIEVDGRPIAAEEKTYVMLNKPRGLVTTRDDPEGRETVYSCLKDAGFGFLSPVGRLDKASEGLLLFTNDTVFAQRLLDPATHVPKIYHVQVGGRLDDRQVRQLETGVSVEGETWRAASVRIIRQGEKNTWLEVRLEEGRNRQIRRMLESIGVECLRLVRVAIGDVELGDLPKGDVRRLTVNEIAILNKATGLDGR